MADRSAIEWTDATWNPTTGCTKISPGCAHCYIERTPAFRIAGNRFERGKTDIAIYHDRLAQPLHWRKPRRVFVNSLSDLFHEDISDAFIDQVFAVMALAPQHTFQVLTKRAERMRAYVTADFVANRVFAAMKALTPKAGVWSWPTWDDAMKHVWLGVSVENQHFADERIPLLLQTPAAVRFISAEPLLGPVNLQKLDVGGGCDWDSLGGGSRRYGAGGRVVCYPYDSGPIPSRLDWVIVGGESGPGARPFDLAWARSIINQCHGAGVPVFVKQLGASPYADRPDNHTGDPIPTSIYLRSRKGGDPGEWPEDLRVREFPRTEV